MLSMRVPMVMLSPFVHLKGKAGVRAAQYLLRLMEGRGRFRVQIGRVKVLVKHLSGEIVGTCVHKAHENGGVYACNGNHTLFLH